MAERFADFHAGRGFRCRNLSNRWIVQHYGARTAIECEAVRQTTLRASRSDLDAIDAASDAGLAHIAQRVQHASGAVRLAFADLYAPQGGWT